MSGIRGSARVYDGRAATDGGRGLSSSRMTRRRLLTFEAASRGLWLRLATYRGLFWPPVPGVFARGRMSRAHAARPRTTAMFGAPGPVRASLPGPSGMPASSRKVGPSRSSGSAATIRGGAVSGACRCLGNLPRRVFRRCWSVEIELVAMRGWVVFHDVGAHVRLAELGAPEPRTSSASSNTPLVGSRRSVNTRSFIQNTARSLAWLAAARASWPTHRPCSRPPGGAGSARPPRSGGRDGGCLVAGSQPTSGSRRKTRDEGIKG